MGYHLKTLDPELGCTSETPYPRFAGYEAGFRFYTPSLGRWLSRDPVGEEGGAAVYGFVGDDPANRVDMFGLWGADVHNDLTRRWAIQSQFNALAAVAVGYADEAVDNAAATSPKNPEGQRYHFNHGNASPDTRLALSDAHFIAAKNACSAKMGADDPETAVKELGLSLHPLQDWVAHGDYGKISGLPFHTAWLHNADSPQRSCGDPFNYPDDPTLDAVGSSDARPAGMAMKHVMGPGGLILKEWAVYRKGTSRIEKTERLSKVKLRAFIDWVRTEAKPCGKCRAYFLWDNDPRRYR